MLELIEAKNVQELLFYTAVRVAVILVCWLFMIVATIVDLWSGVTTAQAVGKPIMSNGFRRTISKIGDYTRLMLFALMFDLLGGLFTFYVLPFATILCTIAVLKIEGTSVIENNRIKKSHAADVPDIVKQVVQAMSTKDATKVIEKIRDEFK